MMTKPTIPQQPAQPAMGADCDLKDLFFKIVLRVMEDDF